VTISVVQQLLYLARRSDTANGVKKSIGSSLASLRRGRIASQLSRELREGGERASGAAFRLKQRQRALKGIGQYGWEWRLKLANEARKQNRKERRKRERGDEICRPWRESTRDL
jgi:hypothetical protein